MIVPPALPKVLPANPGSLTVTSTGPGTLVTHPAELTQPAALLNPLSAAAQLYFARIPADPSLRGLVPLSFASGGRLSNGASIRIE